MNKLKNKTFIILLLILTTFLLSLIVIFNYNIYHSEYKDIENKIKDINKVHNNYNSNINPIFVGLEVYVISLDKKFNIIDIVNYANDGLSNEDIINLVNDNIKKYKLNEIQNLYFNKYIFCLNNNYELIVINNTIVNSKLIYSLKFSVIMFILLESIVIYLSIILTKWLTKPVYESFEKQKQFIYDASHELKTPLSIIIGSTEMLESDSNKKKWIDNIKDESERMNKLIKDLLDLAKYENEEKQSVFSEINISKLVEKTALTFESLVYEKGLKIEYNISNDILYRCDKDKIKQLLVILIDNAIKHAYDKSKIKILLYKENNIILEVINRGDEIPKDERTKIFERFYRIDKSRNRNDNRYGIGLAIAKQIVLKHNGKISVDCNNGYTTFKVTLK